MFVCLVIFKEEVGKYKPSVLNISLSFYHFLELDFIFSLFLFYFLEEPFLYNTKKGKKKTCRTYKKGNTFYLIGSCI